MAEVTGKKIKELELITTVSGNDDLIVDTSPATGSPQTKRISVEKFKEEMNRELNSALYQKTNGRFVLPEGLKIAWGTFTPKAIYQSGILMQTIELPFTYSNTDYYVSVTKPLGTTDLGLRVNVGASIESAKKINIFVMDPQRQVTTENSFLVRWFTIGY